MFNSLLKAYDFILEKVKGSWDGGGAIFEVIFKQSLIHITQSFLETRAI